MQNEPEGHGPPVAVATLGLDEFEAVVAVEARVALTAGVAQAGYLTVVTYGS